MANILLVDASPLIYQNYMAMKRFSTKSGVPTGLRFGFMRSMRSYTGKLQADRTAICFDLPGRVKKAEGIADYKANREFTDDKKEMYSQVDDLREMIGLTRYAQVQAEGYEADDLLAHLARRYAEANHTVYIITPDNDLLQLVGPNIKIWMPPKSKQKAWFKDDEYCLDQFGVEPYQLLYFRSLTGDTSDNIQGLTNKSTIKARLANGIRSNVDPDTTIDEFEEKVLPELFRQIPNLPDNALEIWTRNYNLMRLHDPKAEELEIKKGAKDNEALRTLFQELEMKSLVPAVGKFTGIEEIGLESEEG